MSDPNADKAPKNSDPAREAESREPLPSSLGTPFRPGLSTMPTASSPAVPTAPAPADLTPETLRQACVDMVKTCYDPEIPVDIWELGLIYALDVNESLEVDVSMTLTSPMCPVAEILPPEIEAKLRAVPGVKQVRLELTWEPPWEPSMMSEAARLDLGF